ncbi:MAG: SRPBCC family protein [Actinomycetota bacterium]
MRTLRQSVTIERGIDDVFALVSDPDRYPEFFKGLTKWTLLSDAPGPDARYRVLMKVGSIEAGGKVRVNEWTPPERIGWEWEQGLHQWGRWILSKQAGGTELTLETSFHLSGGPAGLLVEHLAGRTVARNLRSTLLAARRLLESEG